MKIMDDKSIRSALVTTPQPAAGWDEAIDACKRIVTAEPANWQNTGYGRSIATRIAEAFEILRREAPAPAEGVTDKEDKHVGGVTWHSSDEDSGPDVGISVYLGNEQRLWLGEITTELFEESGHFESDGGWFIIWYKPEPVLIAKCADDLDAREFVEHIASLISTRPDTAESWLREALNEVVTNGEWTEGEQRGEWKISKDVYDLAIEARDKALSPPSGGDEGKESDLGCMADFSPGDPANLKELLASEPSPPADRREIVARKLMGFDGHQPWELSEAKQQQYFARADLILAALDGGR